MSTISRHAAGASGIDGFGVEMIAIEDPPNGVQRDGDRPYRTGDRRGGRFRGTGFGGRRADLLGASTECRLAPLGSGVRRCSSVDNCLLAPNPDQAPAIRPPDGRAIGPDDLLALSADRKARHPGARFRDDSELGEACSGYNKNYLRTKRDKLGHFLEDL